MIKRVWWSLPSSIGVGVGSGVSVCGVRKTGKEDVQKMSSQAGKRYLGDSLYHRSERSPARGELRQLQRRG